MRSLVIAAILVYAISCADAATFSREALLADLRNRDFAELEDELAGLQRGYEAGTFSEWDLYERYTTFELPAAETEDIDAWVNARPTSYPARLAAAFHYVALGWRSRGSEFADRTAPARIRDAHGLFERAMEHLQASLPLTATPIVSHVRMIDISRHFPKQGAARDHYQHALEVAPRSYLVRRMYLATLEPRWGGSFAAMDQVIEDARAAGLTRDAVKRLESRKLAHLGAHYENLNQLDKALALLDQSVAIDESASANVARGRVLVLLGRHDQAKVALDRAAELDPYDLYVHNNLGTWYWSRGDGAKALEAYKRSALVGNDWSANRAGQLFESGEAGVAADLREAFRWYLLGAKLGNVNSMYSAGECYRAGDCGVKVDFAAARRWFEKGADYGNHRGMIGLAAMIWHAEGVPHDAERAAALWTQAAQSPLAEERLVAYLNIVGLLPLPRMMRAIVEASGHVVLASLMLFAMLLAPLAALAIGIWDGAVPLRREPAAPDDPLKVFPQRSFWLRTWGVPLGGGLALWIGFALGLPIAFPVITLVFASISFPSFIALYRLASGELSIVLDPDGMSFRAGGARHRISWRDAVFFQRSRTAVTIGTQAGMYYALDGGPFGGLLWNEIVKRAPARAFEPEAHTRMPGYARQVEAADHEAAHAFDSDIAVSPALFIRAILWIGFVGFGAAVWAAAVYYRRDAPSDVAYWLVIGTFVFFCALSFVAILTSGTVTFSRLRVRYDTSAGAYALAWSEVVAVGTDVQGSALVFSGGGKRLVTLGPGYWRTRDREVAYPALLSFLAHRNIKLTDDKFAAFKISRGCRA